MCHATACWSTHYARRLELDSVCGSGRRDHVGATGTDVASASGRFASRSRPIARTGGPQLAELVSATIGDAPSAPPRPKRPPSGRKPGGQPGHLGHGRKLIPVEQVQHRIDLKPTTCDQCGTLLLGEDTQPVRHQVLDLPRVEPEVTEYRQHTLTCVACGAQTQAEWPAEIPSGSFGPRLQATVGYLTGRVGVSQRDVAELLHTLFQTELSLGSLPGPRRPSQCGAG
jgi:transposase